MPNPLVKIAAACKKPYPIDVLWISQSGDILFDSCKPVTK